MDDHPIKEFKGSLERSIEKRGTRLMLLDYTRIVIPKEFRTKGLAKEHIFQERLRCTWT